MAKAVTQIEEALAMADRDRAPSLPGEWTEALHREVVPFPGDGGVRTSVSFL